MFSRLLLFALIVSVFLSFLILSSFNVSSQKQNNYDVNFLKKVANVRGVKFTNQNFAIQSLDPPPNLKIDPPINKSSIPKTLTISLYATNVSNFVALEANVSFPANQLNFSQYSFSGTALDGKTVLVFVSDSNSAGEYMIAFSIGGGDSFTGSGQLVKLIFNVIGTGNGTLHLHNSTMVNSTIDPIDHSETDGLAQTWPRYDADVNGDGMINSTDVSLITSKINTPVNCSNVTDISCHLDVNHDGVINQTDVDIATAEMGQTVIYDPDVSGDGAVDITDLIAVYLNQFQNPCASGAPAYLRHMDYDHDCAIDIGDLVGVYILQFQPFPP